MKTQIISATVGILSLLSFSATAANKPHILAGKKPHRVVAVMSIANMTKNLQFDFGKADLRSTYTEQLNQLAKTVINGNYSIALRGHADAIGGYVFNWKLSQKRADTIKNYLVNQGVPEAKIVTTPFGSTIPIANNSTPSGRQKNRRVEVKLG